MVFEVSVFAALVVSSLLALGAPLVASLLWARATHVGWKPFGAGALVFFLSQPVLRLPWMAYLGTNWKPQAEASRLTFAAWLFVAAGSAGLFEECGRWLGYRLMLKAERSKRVAVAYGLGHGGLESVLLVGVGLAVSTALYWGMGHGTGVALPEAANAALLTKFSSLTPTSALFGGLERLFALTFQVGFSALVLQGVQRRQLRWLGLSILLHASLDAAAVTGARAFPAAIVEGVLAVLAFGALLLLWRWWRGGRSAGADSDVLR